jgi:hypothetical protein
MQGDGDHNRWVRKKQLSQFHPKLFPEKEKHDMKPEIVTRNCNPAQRFLVAIPLIKLIKRLPEEKVYYHTVCLYIILATVVKPKLEIVKSQL